MHAVVRTFVRAVRPTTSRPPRRRTTVTVAVLLALVGSAAGVAPSRAEEVPTDLLTTVEIVGTPTISGALTVRTTPAWETSSDVTYRFFWRDGDTAVPTPTAESMRLGWTSYGSTYTVTVEATSSDGRQQTLTSAPVGPISDVGAPSAVTIASTADDVTASGTPGVDSSTVATRHGDVVVERTWLRDGVPVPTAGQTEQHVFEKADSGHRLAFRLSARQPDTGLSGSLTSPATPVVGTITPAAPVLGPTPTVKPLDNVEVDLGRVAWSLYPPVSAQCGWSMTWFRDGQLIPGLTSTYKQAYTTEGGARISAAMRTACTTTAPVTFTPVTRTTNTVVVSGKPYTLTPVNYDRYRDVIVRRSGSSRYQFLFGTYSYGAYQLVGANDLAGFDGMSRVVAGGDLNGDGYGDALGQTPTGDLHLYNVLATAPRHLWKVGSGWNAMNLVLLAGDLDGNHVGDVLARRASDGALVLYSGTGARVLPGRVVGTGYRSATRIAVSPDATGDSIPDLYATWPDGTLRLYAGTGTGGLRPGVVVSRGGWNAMTQLTDGGDANLDGKADLYAVDNKNQAWVYYGKGNGQLGTRSMIAAGWYFTAFR